MTRRGFVTGGTWCLDNNKLIGAWPAEDTANEVLSIDRQGGGSACNMALDLRRLDADMPVETIGLVGDDENGRFLVEQCKRAGVGHRQMRVVPQAPTFSVDAFSVAGSGRRTHFFHPGVAKLLRPDDFDFKGSNARYLHLGLPGAHERMDAPCGEDANGWVAVLKAARAAGLKTNLELMTIAREKLIALARPCLPHLDLLIVNDYEIGAAADVETRVGANVDLAAVRRAMTEALHLGAMDVIAVHFPEGGFAASRDGGFEALGSVALPAAEIVGANGAGDAFAAGFFYGLHESWDLRRCLALAHCAGAASMRSISTTGGLASWRDCLALGERWSYRPTPQA
jgi:sugar/nucleoside kinase (ribokinase family)